MVWVILKVYIMLLDQIGHKPYLYSSNKSENFDLIFLPGVGSFNKASEILYSGEYLNFKCFKQKCTNFWNMSWYATFCIRGRGEW